MTHSPTAAIAATDANKSGDEVSQAPIASAGGSFVIVNNVVLLLTTLLGAGCSVYADLHPASTVGELRLWMAGAWVLGIVLALFVLGHHEKNRTATGIAGRIAWGAKLMLANAGYAFLVLFMALAAGWMVYSKQVSDQRHGGAIAALGEAALRIEQETIRAQVQAARAASAAESTDKKADTLLVRTARIEAVVTQPLSPREQLAKAGVRWEPEAFSNALVSSDIASVRLFIDGGWDLRSPAAASEGGNALGQFAHFGRATNPTATTEMIRLLARKIDLSEPVAAFRGMPPMTFVATAIQACNLPIVKALAAAGIDVRKVGRAELPSHLGGTTVIDPVALLQNGSTSFAGDATCSEADRGALLQLVDAAAGSR